MHTNTHTNCRHTPNSDTPNNHTVATEINEWFAYMRDDDPNRRNDEYTFVGVSVTHRYLNASRWSFIIHVHSPTRST